MQTIAAPPPGGNSVIEDIGGDWPAVINSALQMLIAAGIIEDESTFGAACREADARQRMKSSRNDRNEMLRHLMDDSVSLSAAWTTINKRPAPHVTVEAIKQAVRERGEAALEEPSTKERLQRCDGAALAALDRWLLKHGFSNDRTRNS